MSRAKRAGRRRPQHEAEVPFSGTSNRQSSSTATKASAISPYPVLFAIATMELVDNAFIVAVPAALAAGLSDVLCWSLITSLVVAFVVTVPVNRWVIARGRGHAVVHHLH